MISKPHNWLSSDNKGFLVEVHPVEDAFTIRMEAKVTHIDEEKVGLQCHFIDIDSASHLRRLVELNIGDENILNREFSALISSAA